MVKIIGQIIQLEDSLGKKNLRAYRILRTKLLAVAAVEAIGHPLINGTRSVLTLGTS